MNSRTRRTTPAARIRPRISQRRPEKRTLLVVCEGRETERNYLDGLRRDDAVSRRFAVKVLPGKGGSRQQIIQRAVDRKNNSKSEFDEVWCVMDVERLAHPDARTDLDLAVQLARVNQIQLCLSNPAFEIWALAHFVRTSRMFNDCDAVIVELNKYWRAEFQIDYDKTDQRIYSRLAQRMRPAIENAKAVREVDHRDKADLKDCNSATELYKLVSYLLGESPNAID